MSGFNKKCLCKKVFCLLSLIFESGDRLSCNYLNLHICSLIQKRGNKNTHWTNVHLKVNYMLQCSSNSWSLFICIVHFYFNVKLFKLSWAVKFIYFHHHQDNYKWTFPNDGCWFFVTGVCGTHQRTEWSAGTTSWKGRGNFRIKSGKE